MTPILSAELDQMERLLADLLPETTSQEEAQILQLHARLQTIYEAQSELHASRDRLMALQSRAHPDKSC